MGKIRCGILFRAIIFAAIIFMLTLPGSARGDFSYKETNENTNVSNTAVSGEKSPNLFSTTTGSLSMAGWVLGKPVTRIWTAANFLSLDSNDLVTRLRMLEQSPSTRKKYLEEHSLDSSLPEMKKTLPIEIIGMLMESSLKKATNRKAVNKSGGKNTEDLPPGSDILNDYSRPEMVGRMSGGGAWYDYYNGRKRIKEDIDGKGSTEFARIDNFNKKLARLLEESGNFQTSQSEPDSGEEVSGETGENQETSKKVNRLRGYRRESIYLKEPDVKTGTRKKKTYTLEGEEGPHRLQIKADEIRRSRGMVTADGGARVEFRGVVLEADQLQYNEYSKDVTASGNVVITRGDDKVSGSSLFYNPEMQKAEIKDAYGYAGEVSVGEVELQRTIFFWGKLVRWEKNTIYIKNGTATSCDLPPPDYHYHISGDEIIIHPQDKMIVRKARLFFGDKQWLGLNSAVFPLRQRDPRRRQSLIPQIGRNDQEGYYVKEEIGYLWGKKDYGAVHLDWYDKVGIGAGIEHYYHLGDSGAGKFYYYSMGGSGSSTNRYNVSNRVYYRFPNNIFVSVNYTTERYQFPYYSSPNIINADFYISHNTDKKTMAAQVKDYIEGDNRNYGINFLHRYKFSSRFQSQVVLDYLSSESSIRRLYRLNALGRLVYRGDVFDSSLVYDQTTGDRNFYVNREPELAMRTQPLKAGPFDYRLSLAVGNFREMPSDVQSIRSDMKLSLLNKVYPLTDSTKFSLAGGARQLAYDTGEKKYVLKTHTTLQQDLGKYITLVGTHYFQDKQGYSPLALDYFEKYNVLGGTLEYFNQNNLRLQVNGGYDLDHKQYQSLIPRLEYCPTRKTQFLLSSNYDVENEQWMNLDGQVGFQISPSVAVKYWGLYDFINQKMSYQNYVVELDSHDYSTRLIYKGSQGELWLSFAIKAFPYEKVEVGPDGDRNIISKRLLERAPDEGGL